MRVICLFKFGNFFRDKYISIVRDIVLYKCTFVFVLHMSTVKPVLSKHLWESQKVVA